MAKKRNRTQSKTPPVAATQNLKSPYPHHRVWLFSLWLLSVLTLLIVSVCLFFPVWWYGFIWENGISQSYYYYAIRYLFKGKPAIVCCIFFFIVAATIIYKFKHKLNVLAMRYRYKIITIAVLLVFLSSISSYKTGRRDYVFLKFINEQLQKIYNLYGEFKSIAKIKLDPPIEFYYLNQGLVDSLFNQMLPDLLEKSRSEKIVNKDNYNASIGSGPASIGGSTSQENEVTRHLERFNYSGEKRTLILINQCLAEKRACEITDIGAVLMGNVSDFLQNAFARMNNPAQDFFQLYGIDEPSIEILGIQLNEFKDVFKPDNIKNIINNTISSLPDYILIQAEFLINYADKLSILTGQFSSTPIEVKYIINVPGRLTIYPMKKKNLRVFGRVVERPNKDSKIILVQAIAVF